LSGRLKQRPFSNQIGADFRGEVKKGEDFFADTFIPWIDMDHKGLVSQGTGCLYMRRFSKNGGVFRVGTQTLKPGFCLGESPFKRDFPYLY